MPSRREFLRHLGGGAAAAALLPVGRVGSLMSAPSAIKVGCAAITWGGNDEQAIADIGDLGFPGLQLRANAVRQYGASPTALRELLVGRHLTFVALSSGDVSIDPAAES